MPKDKTITTPPRFAIMNTTGLSAFHCGVQKFVTVVSHDGDKFVCYLLNGRQHFEKACCFSNRPFKIQRPRDHAYASRLLRNKRKQVPFDADFWRKNYVTK